LSFLAKALAQQGNFEEAHAAIGRGRDGMNATGERMWDAELYRTHGLVLLAENNQEESEAAFERALQVARQQQTKSFELRAATSLARLWGDQGRRAEARELLAPVYGWFTEGFDTADLKEAKALLDELQG
jgi:predicted ATPase